MKRFSAFAAIVAALSLLAPSGIAHAQTTSAVVVAACGTPPTTYAAGQNRQVTQDTTGRVCQAPGAGTISGTVTANQGTAGAAAWPVKVDQTTPGSTNGVNVAPSSVSTVGIAPVASTSAEACHVFKASPGNLYGVSGYIGAGGFIMVFDATSAPGDGAVTPKVWVYVPVAGSWSLDYGDIPAVMATGITVCASSTGPLTKTAYSTNTVFSGRTQ